MRNLTIVPMLMLVAGCHNYVLANVTVSSESVNVPDRGIPGKVTGVVENRGERDALLDSRPFTWLPGQDGQKNFDFNVEKGSTLVTVLKYPGGATLRATTQVPSKPTAKSWPFPVTIGAVDVSTQSVSIDYLKNSAESLALVGSSAADASTTPPSTNFEQAAKYMGSITIVDSTWTPTKGVMSEYIANVPVLHAPPAPVAGVGIQRKLCITSDTSGKVALSIPVYGSLGAAITDGKMYKLNLDIAHNAILDLDQGIFGALIDPKNKEGTVALAALKYWASVEPNAKVLVLRSVRYIVRGTIGVIEGKTFSSNLDAAVASVFTSNAAYSFNVNDETYVPLTGNITAWLWKLQKASLSELVKKAELARGTESRPRSPAELAKVFESEPVSIAKVQ